MSLVQADRRRIQLILEALDERKGRKALQLISEEMRKRPNDTSLFAFKSYALLLSSSHSSDIIEAAQRAMSGGVSSLSEESLRALIIAFQQLKKYDVLSSIYAALPLETYGEELFFSYVNDRKVVEQQSCAMTCYKKLKEKKYLRWASASNFVLGCEVKKNELFLKLAQRFAEDILKSDENGKIKEEFGRMYVEILQESGQWSTVTQQLTENGLLSNIFALNMDKLTLLAESHFHLGEWKELRNVTMRMLISRFNEEDVDNWFAWSYYVRASVEMCENDNTFNPLSFITEMRKKYEMVRGPLLAKMEWWSVKMDRGELMGSVVEYVKSFGEKSVAFWDLRRYLEKLDKEDGIVMIEMINGCMDQSNPSHMLLLEKIRRLFGVYESDAVEYKCKLSVEYMSRSGDDESMADYGILAVHLLLDCYEDTNDNKFLYFSGAVCLNMKKKYSRNFHFSLLLVRISSILGGVRHALDSYESMDIKHFQNECLCYLVIHEASSCGCVDVLDQVCDFVDGFGNEHERTTPAFLSSPFREETYSKVREIYSFCCKMDRSVYQKLSEIERFFSNLFSNCSTVSEMLSYLQKVPKEVDPDDLLLSSDCGVLSFFEKRNSRLEEFIKKHCFSPKSFSSSTVSVRNLLLPVSFLDLYDKTLPMLNEMSQYLREIVKTMESSSINDVVFEEEEMWKMGMKICLHLSQICVPAKNRDFVQVNSIVQKIVDPLKKYFNSVSQCFPSFVIKSSSSCRIDSKVCREISMTIGTSMRIMGIIMEHLQSVFPYRKQQRRYRTEVFNTETKPLMKCVYDEMKKGVKMTRDLTEKCIDEISVDGMSENGMSVGILSDVPGFSESLGEYVKIIGSDQGRSMSCLKSRLNELIGDLNRMNF